MRGAYAPAGMTDRFPLAVLVSGNGSNLQAIFDAAADPAYSAEVVVVISDRSGVKALDLATAAGIPTSVVRWGDFEGPESFTVAVCDAAAQHGAAALVLAGFMRILSALAMERYPDRIVNIHPALLPAFPGTNAVGQALAHGVKVTGVTVHLVDEKVDHGPIIQQAAVPVLAGDSHESLRARIQAVEHEMYPRIVDALARDEISVDGRIVTWDAG